MPVLSALADGYEVYFLTDASGGASREAHDMAVQRMIQAGTIPTTTWPYVSELQCDWARAETAGAVTKLFKEHGGGFGQELRWGWELVGLKEGTRSHHRVLALPSHATTSISVPTGTVKRKAVPCGALGDTQSFPP